MRRELASALASLMLALPLSGCDCSGGDAPEAEADSGPVVDAGFADAGLGGDAVAHATGQPASGTREAGDAPPEAVPRPVEGASAEVPEAPTVSDPTVGTEYVDLIEHFAQTQLAQGVHNCRERTSYSGKLDSVVIRVLPSGTREVVGVTPADDAGSTDFAACLDSGLASMRLPANPRPRETRDSKNGVATITALPGSGYQVEFSMPDSL